jgi:hypothetical protein
VGIQWQSHKFVRRENGRWENIVMWDKGCSLLHALAFVIKNDKEAMEVASASIEATRDYDKVCLHIIVENESKFASIFRMNYK